MSTAPQDDVDPVDAANAAGLPLVTIAMCGNRRKHSQSFIALRIEAESHNRTLWQRLRSRFAEDGSVGVDGNNGGKVDAMRDHALPSQSSLVSTPHVFFRCVNLNYDALSQRMVLCADLSIQGEMPHQESSTDDRSTCSHSRSDSSSSSSSSASAPHFGDQSSRRKTSHAQPRSAGGAVRPREVDVLLHKVASFGTPDAAVALTCFVHLAHCQRAAANKKYACAQDGEEKNGKTLVSSWPRPQMVVVDELDKVELLTTRCMLYKLLDRDGADGRKVASIPRTFRWELAEKPLVSPVGASSAEVLDTQAEAARSSANGPPGEKWWIAKPDEGTGPSFTHHLVLWKSGQAEPVIPPAVQATLPKEATAFVVQEYYIFSLPVVLKVYVVGDNVFVKVSPTIKLLSMIESQLAREEERATRTGAGGDSRTLGNPIFMDSQDKEMFTASGLLTASRSISRAITPEVSGGVFSIGDSASKIQGVGGSSLGSAALDAGMTGYLAQGTPPSPNLAGEPAVTYGLSADSQRQSSPGGNASASEIPQSSDAWLRTVAAAEYWDAFLAPGTPAHRHIVQLARSLSAREGGLGLSLYGFDIVLLPRHLAHEYQRAACPHGFGYPADGGCKSSAPPFSGDDHSLPYLTRQPGAVFAYGPSSMFDLETGEPTRLLRESVPVVIDVNYFPGYKGMATANADMLEMVCRRVAEQPPARAV